MAQCKLEKLSKMQSSQAMATALSLPTRPPPPLHRRTSPFTSTRTGATLSLAPLYLTTCSLLYYCWSLPDLICVAHTISYFLVKLFVVPSTLILGYQSAVGLEALRFMLVRA